MSNQHLVTYLQDHLAGSVGALELLDHLEQAQAETNVAGELARLRTEITADRTVLENLIGRFGATPSGPRKAAAWLGEKLVQIKLTLDDSAAGALRLFEGLEAVSLGIEGKRGLWQILSVLAPANPLLQDLDYASLIRRAAEQRGQVEHLWLSTAPLALIDDIDERR
jgi:hypothetical protein